ncbi:MAG: hypothetical protein ABI766_07915 [Gemmatimonadales bacterium]
MKTAVIVSGSPREDADDARWPGHLPALIGHFPLSRLAERLAHADPGNIEEGIDWGESV